MFIDDTLFKKNYEVIPLDPLIRYALSLCKQGRVLRSSTCKYSHV
nr:MAG TPA: hypothetical protein [Caudoviricetes sp.]